jgi:hypothetical protein
MNDHDVFEIELQAAELVFVAAHLGLPSLRLLELLVAPDQWDLDDEALQSARETLQERSYVKAADPEELVIDLTVAGLVGALAHAQSTLILRRLRETDIEAEVRHICFASGLMVEHAERSERHVFTAVRDKDILLQRLESFIGIKTQPAPFAKSWNLVESVMQDVPYIVAGDGIETAVAFLVEEGVPKEFARAFVDALDHPLCQTTLQAVRWKNHIGQVVDSLTIIEDVYGLWILYPKERETEESVINVVPCAADGAMNKVVEIVDLALSFMQQPSQP